SPGAVASSHFAMVMQAHRRRDHCTSISGFAHAQISHRADGRCLCPASLDRNRRGWGAIHRVAVLRRSQFCHHHQHRCAYLGKIAFVATPGRVQPRVSDAFRHCGGRRAGAGTGRPGSRSIDQRTGAARRRDPRGARTRRRRVLRTQRSLVPAHRGRRSDCGRVSKAEPLLATLASDPTLRGIASALESGLTAVDVGRLKLDAMTQPLTLAADTLDDIFAARPASFSWVAMAQGRPPEPRELRRFLQIDPVLDFGALEPGAKANSAIRTTAAELNLASDYQARVRLTGLIPIADQEFASVREGAALNLTLTVVAVLIILWFALHSFRIILAVFFSLIVGLAATAAVGLAMVHALNLISVAFFVLFIGIGVDFGIQFSVRYRSERHDVDDIHAALMSAAAKSGGPLALAGLATAAGFMSFLPTSYRGLAELGQIAGCGMLIAFLASITLLPALLTLFSPPGEARSMGFVALAPVDRFLERHRVPVIVGTLLVVIGGSPLLLHLPFDFYPMNLRDPTKESVATYNERRRAPRPGGTPTEAVAPTLAEADATAARLAKVPEVSRTLTLSNFTPADQEPKLAAIHAAAAKLDPSLSPQSLEPAPSDEETVT